MKINLILFLVVLSVGSFSQSKFELFPSALNIHPFAANTLEPRVGTLFQLNNNELRLDIGNSLDILHYSTENSITYSAGADFFTYTLLRGEKEFHFPVDAVDYLFGINIGIKAKADFSDYGIRLRLSHISAHFVDGHFDHRQAIWRDGRDPRVYSREFIEIAPYYSLSDLRVYLGYSYLFHVDPTYIGRNSYQFGFDYFFNNILSDYLHPYAGYDLKISKIDKYTGNNSFVAGIKIGNSRGRGISIYYNYYSGRSIHGEYFDYYKTYSAVGFNLDL
ncbi:MAG: DUF1207 domain-containing protein [Ignavibacteriales bacterium]|nr:DUF1207 domain-containing protein [Ignavibacteriales bacterium]